MTGQSRSSWSILLSLRFAWTPLRDRMRDQGDHLDYGWWRWMAWKETTTTTTNLGFTTSQPPTTVFHKCFTTHIRGRSHHPPIHVAHCFPRIKTPWLPWSKSQRLAPWSACHWAREKPNHHWLHLKLSLSQPRYLSRKVISDWWSNDKISYLKNSFKTKAKKNFRIKIKKN